MVGLDCLNWAQGFQMVMHSLHGPALLMKLGGDPELTDDPSLGEAVAHVISQPREEHWLYDIITEYGLITSANIVQIALTPAFAHWEKGLTKRPSLD